MGFSRPRKGAAGKTRYTAYYTDLRGQEKSAGTYSSKRIADKKWQDKEAKVAEGRAGDPSRGRQTFERYVRETWFPNHVMELRTRENYSLYLERVLFPEFGPIQMRDFLPGDIRDWVTRFQAGIALISPPKKGQRATISNSASVIEYCFVILSAIFTTALNDQIIFLHPCKGVNTPTVAVKIPTIITPEQFDMLYAELPDDEMRLLVETDIETGLRWGELTELRVKDINHRTRKMKVRRVVVEVTKAFRVDGQRFVVKEYPKDSEHRELTLSVHMNNKIARHIDNNGLKPDDLIFELRNLEALGIAAEIRPDFDTETLGLTPPNSNGRQYRHGTKTAYVAAKCRCDACRGAFSAYRAERRANGKDGSRVRRIRSVTTDGHIPRSWFRSNVWVPARDAAGLDAGVSVKHLRAAHASWLLAGGADIEVVRERLGHGSISTTQKYLGSLPEADDAAVDAFARIRNRSRKTSAA